MDYQLRRQITLLRNKCDKLLDRGHSLELRRKQIKKVKELYIGNHQAKELHVLLAREEFRLLEETTHMIGEIKDTMGRLDILWSELTLTWSGAGDDVRRLGVEKQALGGKIWSDYRNFVNELYSQSTSGYDWLDFEE